jgi:hypothetical protein
MKDFFHFLQALGVLALLGGGGWGRACLDVTNIRCGTHQNGCRFRTCQEGRGPTFPEADMVFADTLSAPKAAGSCGGVLDSLSQSVHQAIPP